MPKFKLRTLSISCVAIGFVVWLYFAQGPWTPPETSSRPRGVETLPDRLTDQEFWHMITDFSEAGGYFRSDNFLSNEAGYQFIIPSLKETVAPGGVYVGVGPEQNFTYILALQPKIAFVVDIRRQNMLELLFYKALMELAADRAEFLSMLFARPLPAGLTAESDPETMFQIYDAAEPSLSLFNKNLRRVLDHLQKTHGFTLSSDDENSIRYVYNAFFESGPRLNYVFLGSYNGGCGMPTYADLMSETDGAGQNWSFLATEEHFRMVQDFQRSNRIVPLVGDFAGERAIRAVGRYLNKHNAVVTAFYTSNVEQYLFQDDKSDRFYENVATLPIDSSSTFIRFVLSRGRGFSSRVFARRSRTVSSSMEKTMQAFKKGRVGSYYDVVEMSN